MADYKRA
jgi:hypothetical protein